MAAPCTAQKWSGQNRSCPTGSAAPDQSPSYDHKENYFKLKIMINYIIINTIILRVLEWKVEIGIWKLEHGMVVFGFRTNVYGMRFFI